MMELLPVQGQWADRLTKLMGHNRPIDLRMSTVVTPIMSIELILGDLRFLTSTTGATPVNLTVPVRKRWYIRRAWLNAAESDNINLQLVRGSDIVQLHAVTGVDIMMAVGEYLDAGDIIRGNGGGVVGHTLRIQYFEFDFAP